MKLRFTQLRTLRSSIFALTLLLSVATSFAQVSQSFDALTTEMNCGNTACDYTDPDATDHVLADQGSLALPSGVVIPVSDAGGGTTLGFSTAFVANGNGTEGFTDGDFFGVMGPDKLLLEIGTGAQNGAQAFFLEDTDGAVDMTFSPVFLNGTASPQFSMHYILEETTWETADFVNIRINIDMCAAATTVTLLNTIGQDIDDLNIESTAWTQLMQDLTPYVDCRATLVISFSSNSGAEELVIDNIVFTEGALSPPAGSCPTVGAVSASETSVCIGDPFNVTSTGLVDLAQADNGEQNFGVSFVAFTSTPADPYTGGTNLGTVAFANLTGGGTTASLTAASIADGGSYEIYSILSPAPTDPTCRPSAMTTLTVEGTQPVITGDEVQKLSGNLQDLEANVPGGTWAFVTNSDGMGMIDDVNANPASLMGTAGRSYTIEYTVDNGACGMASDTVTIIFESATDLVLGDIVFVGYASDALTGATGDGFAFVALTDINAGTTISFTEQGWLAAGGFRAGESTVTVTFCDFYGCGSEFNVIANAVSSDFLDAAGNEAGTTTGGNLGLSTSGDQVFAYQGAEPTAGAEENFITAIQMNSDWDADATSTNTSAEPQVFIDNPGNSLAIMPEVDNASFDCANAPANSDVDATRTAVNDFANWTPTNDPISFPVGCDLGCGDPCTTGGTPPVVTSSQGIECGETFSVETESDYINTVDPPSSGASTNQDCSSGIRFRSPNFTDDCGVDSLAITFVAAAGTTPFELPATLEFGGAAGPITYATGMDNFVLPAPSIRFFGGAGGSATTEVIFTVFDSTGLSTSTCSYFIEVTDNQVPEAVCIDELEVFVGDDGTVTLDSLALDNGSTDNCGIADFSLSQSVFNCEDLTDPLVITQTVTDAEGLMGTCMVDVTVSDTTAPVVACMEFTNSFEGCPNFLGANTPNFQWFPLPASGMFGSAVGGSFITPIDLSTCITDNCSDIGEIEVTLGRAFEENRMGDSVTLVNVLIFRDAAGNEATDSVYVRITIKDTEAPDAVCQSISVFLDAEGNASITPADVDGGSTDNCAVADLSLSVDSFTCDDVRAPGDTATTSLASGFLRVTDVNGNLDSCLFRVNVMDTIPPTVTCLIDTVHLDASGSGSYGTFELFEATDNCDVDFAPFDEVFIVDCSNIGTDIIVPTTVSDVNGNTAPTCDAIVRVLDTIAPVITCVSDTIYLDATGGVFDAPGDNVTVEMDNCPPATMVGNALRQFTCADIGVNEFTETRTDGSGNSSECTFTVTVLDTVPPVVVAANDTVYLDASGMAALTADDVDATATANCGDAEVTGVNRLTDTGAAAGAMFSCDDLGNENIQVQIVATDASGNTASDTIIVTVLDTIAPVLTCTDVTVFIDENGEAFVRDTTAAIVSLSDNCTDSAAINIALVAPILSCDGATGMATLTATDATGNVATCMIGLEPVDTIAPVAVCQDVTVELDADGAGSTTAAAVDNGSSDNCDAEGLTLELDVMDFDCDDLGENMVQLIVTDPSGLMDTCMATVTVEDNLDPIVTITADPVMINLTDAMPTMDITLGQFATVTDNCDDDVEVEFDRPLTFGGADIGSGTFELTATDDSGNETTVTINFVVTFDQPNLACVGDINLTLNDDCMGMVIPSMVLTGNTSLIDFFDLDIVVMDSDTTNGPIVDGCGEFVYTISQRSMVDGPNTLGFTGGFAPANWFSAGFTIPGGFGVPPSDEQIVEITHTASTLTMSTTTTVFNSGSVFGAQSSIFFSEPATVTFDYDFNGSDVPFDQAFSLTNFNGVNIDIGFNTVSEESGSVSFDVLPGYLLAIQLRDDGFTDPGTPPSELIITNFVYDPMPAVDVLDLDFESCWGIVTAEDKTPPAVATQIAPIDLLCVDIDDNQVSLLADDVSRCYEVFSSTGATVPGTMATALRCALDTTPDDDGNPTNNCSATVPTFTDGCTERLEICVTESIEFDANDPQCNDVVLIRTFTATEIVVCPSASGESNPSTSSSYVITFGRPSLDDLSDENIEEIAEYNRCAVTTGSIATIRADYPGPRPQDFPFLSVAGRDFPLQTGSAVCNIGVTFSDGDPIITCPYTYKFVRTYTVIDWCTPSDVRTFTQVVKVGDSEAPTFTGPTQDRDFDGVTDDDLVFLTNAGNVCGAYLILDGAGVSAVDNCSPKVVVTATIFPNGDFDATPIGAFDVDLQDSNYEVSTPIPVGTHILRYIYTDDCGNSGLEDFEITVIDGTAPVAICENGLNISITAGSTGGGVSTGIAVLTPSMIDNGSYDDCSDVMLEIARVNGNNVATEAYDQELILTCADLGTVRVGLKVTDAGGNSNFCWLDVLVEDKNIPTCIPPGPQAVTCVAYRAAGLPADITEATEDQLNALFGSAVGIDNCEVTVTSTVSGNVNSCGVGSLTRNFLSTDGEGFVDNDNCVQLITIRGIFDYRVTFPTDEESGCADVPAFDGLDTDEFACDLITFNVTVDTIAAINAPDACFTLRVNYDVINFCEYNQLGECYRIPRDGDGIRNPDTQLLYLNVIPNSTANTDDDIAFLSRFTDRNFNPTAPQRDQLVDDGDDNDGSDDDNDNDSEDSQAANGVGFAYAQDDSRGFFCYVQFIDVYDEDAPTIDADQPEECFAGTSVDCEAEVTLTFTYADECVDPIITAQLDPDHISGSFVPARNLTAAELVAVSGNGTINLTGIPVGTHAVRIRANDGCGNFDTEVIEFCVEGDQAPTPICISQLTVTLMPDGMGGGIAAIWASDYIASDVEDCFGNVVENYSIYTELEAGVAGFEPQVGDIGLTLTCDSDQTTPVRVYSIDSNGSGDYCSVFVLTQLFQPGLCTGNDGTVNGLMTNPNDGELTGVEVTLTGEGGMDLMTMTDDNGAFSFVGLPLGADYTIQPNHPVAVDLATVTVADVIAIGNVILGIDEFDSGYDYLAADVDQDQSLTVGDMVSIQRVILGLDDIYTTGETWGFVPADVEVSDPFAALFPGVININDLAGNVLDADFVGFAYGDVNSVGRSSASLEVDDVQLEAGQTHTMEVSGEALAGFQGTLVLEAGLELVNVTYTGDGALNLNEAASGRIAMIFRTAATVTVDVRATESGLLSDLVRLTDDVTLSEGVNANGTGGALNLAFDNSNIAPATAQNELFQNTPNPVMDVTTIRFRLVESGTAVLTLRDAAGRLLSEQKVDGIAGMNRVELTNLNASGVISYTLTSGDFSATRKMVVVR